MKGLYAVFASLLMCSTAQATTIVLDDFSGTQGPISDLTLDGIAVTNTVGGRTLSINALSFLAPPQNNLQVSDGILDITNGVGDDSIVRVTRTVGASLIPTSATNPTLSFVVVRSDNNPTIVTLSVGGTSLGTFNIPGGANNQTINFLLTGSQIAAFNAGGVLDLRIDGIPGWDLALNQFGLTFDEPTPTVPEPGTLSLLGIGLLGLGWSRWRRTGSEK